MGGAIVMIKKVHMIDNDPILAEFMLQVNKEDPYPFY